MGCTGQDFPRTRIKSHKLYEIIPFPKFILTKRILSALAFQEEENILKFPAKSKTIFMLNKSESGNKKYPTVT